LPTYYGFSINLLHWWLKEEIIGIPNNTTNTFLFLEATLLQKGENITYTASTLGFSLATLSTISLYDSTGVLITKN